MATAPDRTAAFGAITPHWVNDHLQAREVTHTVAIPGLTARGGGPLTVKRTYTLDEIDHDWVSVIVDYEFGDEPVIYGNHPLAIGPLREILPDALPQKPFPKAQRVARDMVASMLAHHDLGGWVLMPAINDRMLDIKPPSRVDGEYERRRYFNTIQEYLPFQADIRWYASNDRISVRPLRENREYHVVSTS